MLCYASVRYVDAVNRTGKGPTFTMSTANPDWCRLDHVAEPWILPGGVSRGAVVTLRELMLRDLGILLYEWRHDPFPEEPEEYDQYGGDEVNMTTTRIRERKMTTKFASRTLAKGLSEM